MSSWSDAYLSGEISEQKLQLVRASRVAFVVAGYRATEKCGIQALGKQLAARLGLETGSSTFPFQYGRSRMIRFLVLLGAASFFH